MNNIVSAVSLVLSASIASAQIEYFDSDHLTNLTLADGSVFVPSSTNGADNQWAIRAFGTNATIYETNGVASEDGPMLRHTVSGLIPTLPYFVYAYMWSADNATWRLRAQVDTVQPVPEIPGYNTIHFAGSSFTPSTALGFNAPFGPQPALNLSMDAAGISTSGHFAPTATVLLQEGNRWLYEVNLGVHAADLNGEIWVYLDDLANNFSSNRTFFDGVGVEVAPTTFGGGCGAPGTIGFDGPPLVGQPWVTTLTGGAPNGLGVVIGGFSDTTWSGGALPFDLVALGFPGCNLYAATDLLDFVPLDANGNASYSVVVPPAFAATLYWQWGVLTNSLAVTPGLRTVFHD